MASRRSSIALLKDGEHVAAGDQILDEKHFQMLPPTKNTRILLSLDTRVSLNPKIVSDHALNEVCAVSIC